MPRFIRHIYESLLPYETRQRFYKLRHPGEYARLRQVVHPSDKGDFSLKPYDEYRCIFVHITKTAGTAVAKSLFGYLPYHYTAIDYRVIYGRQTFDDYFKFAFVRNPWDRLYSAWRYLKAGGWNEDDKRWAQQHLVDDDFNAFVCNWLSHDNIRRHIHFRPQHDFICDDKGELLLDAVAYFETINEDFARIAQRLGISASLGRHNASPASSYLDIYTPQSRQRAAEIYARDIAMFGYDFDGIVRRHPRAL